MHRKKLPLGQPYLLATKLDRAGLHHHLFQLTAHAASHIFGAANEFDFRAMGGLHIILAAKVAAVQKRDFGFVRIEGFPQIARQGGRVSISGAGKNIAGHKTHFRIHMQRYMALLANSKKGILLGSLLLIANNLLAVHGELLAALTQQFLSHSRNSDFFRTTIIHINGN